MEGTEQIQGNYESLIFIWAALKLHHFVYRILRY